MTEGRFQMIRLVSAVVLVLVLNATPLFGQAAVNSASDLIVKAAAADVHKAPTVASPVVGTARSGMVLEIRRNLGSWVEVPWPNSESGFAFVHVNTGTIARRSGAAPLNGAEASVAQIHAVAAAATAASAANSNGRAAGQPMVMSQAGAQSPYVSLPEHRIGMGALMNSSQPRFGVTARTWWQHGLGVQFHVSRPQLESADGRLMTSTQLAPSAMYALPDAVTNAVWLRPYVGGGPRFYRANTKTALGYETFGGAEATLAAMPQFALSFDMGYRWARPSFDGFEPRKIGYSFAAHWYLR